MENIAHHESWYGDFDKSRVEKLMEWAKKSANKRLDQICNKYLGSCPLYIKHVAVENPAQAILTLINKEKLDMVLWQAVSKKEISGSDVFRILSSSHSQVPSKSPASFRCILLPF